jgi:hypothetical protein
MQELSLAPTAELRIGCHGCHATRKNDLKRPLWAIANRLREEVVRAGHLIGSVEVVHGPENVQCAEDELVVLCLVRDGAMWIHSFVEHYLALGAKHIFFLDNGSVDDTVERASRYKQVSVYRTNIPFKHFELGLRRWLTRTLGWKRWSVAPDADELWDYPYSDHVPLRDFLRYLNHGGYKAVVAHALDMFSDVPFSQLASTPEDDIKKTYRFYDISDIIKTREMYWIRNGQVQTDHIFCTFGGVRQRFFGTECLCQTRHALHFADEMSHPYKYDGHFTAGAPVADVTTVLLHYKFVGTLYEQAQKNLLLRNHHGGSENYRGFVEVLREHPDFCLHTDKADELARVDQLVDKDFLTVSSRYARFAEQGHRSIRARGAG